MTIRSLSRTAVAAVAACSLSVAVAAPAGAVPSAPDAAAATGLRPAQEMPDGRATLAPRLYTAGTDVAASDQQSPIATTKPAPTVTPAIAPAPTWPLHPVALKAPADISSPPSGASFHWDDAGIGAGGALVVVLVGLGGAYAIRRRQAPGTRLAA